MYGTTTLYVASSAFNVYNRVFYLSEALAYFLMCRCCSYNSINMDGTLMRKAMHADPESYVTSMAPGQYWTWGTHMRGVKGDTQTNKVLCFYQTNTYFLSFHVKSLTKKQLN